MRMGARGGIARKFTPHPYNLTCLRLAHPCAILAFVGFVGRQTRYNEVHGLGDDAASIYRQLANELARAIRAGRWRPGERLPTVRALASERQLDPSTVNRAYQQLAAEGLVESRGRKGTLVRAQAAPDALAAVPGIPLRCAGSHDFALGLLARHLRPYDLWIELSPTGSSAGLRALAAGQAQIAASHLLDDDGVGYNRDALDRLIPGRALRLITLFEREQGLLVARGNPLGLRCIADLAQPGVRLVNRQPGSGTRVLFERLLSEADLPGTAISGYAREVTTHLEVAAAVAGGSADVGLGIAAAARALDLGFITLVRERYELVLPAESLAAPWFGPLIETIASPAFRGEVEALGGYDLAYSGWLRASEG
jgi:molybdate-binding protein